jgi:hypothetical protein
MTLLIACVCTSFLTLPINAEINRGNKPVKNDSLRKEALKVFIDCPFCQFSYLMEKVSFINYVREVSEADVYIFISRQDNSSGGSTYSIFYKGQKNYANMSDTIYCQQTPYMTDDESRIDFVNTLKMGLMRYVAKTPLAKSITIDYAYKQTKNIVEDQWKNWVFTLQTSGSMHNEASYKSFAFSSGVYANKITEDNKLRFWSSTYYNTSKYKVDTGYTNVVNRSYDIGNLYVKSLTDHWSVGESADYSSNTYYNNKYAYSFLPAIEYNIFPYADFTKRQLRFLYKIGYVRNNYIDTTVFNRTYDNIYKHTLAATFEMIEKWGSATTAFTASNYLNDFEKNNISLWASFNVRLYRGLSVYASGGYSLMHDQIYLPKGEATDQDILLRQRQLQTQYMYYMNFGVSYTFGSMINNVVNPRFGN